MSRNSSLRALFPILVVISIASCKPSGNGTDQDAGHDMFDDADAWPDAEDDTTGDAGDVPVDGGSDIGDVMDGGDVQDEDTVTPCTTPGLTVGTPVTVAAPGALVGGLGLAGGAYGLYGLAWSDAREIDVVPNEEVFFAVLEADGSMVGSEVQLSNAPLNSRTPSVVWAMDRFTALWGDARSLPAGNVFFGAVDSAGSMLGSESQVTTGGVSAMYVSATWSGSRIGMAWTDNRDTTMDVYFAQVQVDGTLDGGITPIISAAGNSFRPRIVWTGSGYAVAWDDTVGGEAWEPHVQLALLGADGSVVLGPTPISGTTGTASRASIAFSGSLLMVCWEDFRDGLPEIYCSTFDTSGAVQVADTPVTASDGGSTWPSLLHGPDGFALAWAQEDGMPNDDEVRFALISDDLGLTEGDAPLTDTPGEIDCVSLARTGAGYAVAFVQKDATAMDEDAVVYLPIEYCPE